MALIFKDRVKQLSTTNGTTNVVMTSTIGGFQTFANALADADTTYYCIVDDTNDDFEVGLGTWAEGSSTLTRTTILESSNSNNAVNFSGSVAKEVFITYPAEKAVFLNANNKLVIGGVEYLSATTNRWHKQIAGGQTITSASGNDDNGNALTFSGDQVDVFLNGIRLSKDAGDYSLNASTNTVTFSSNCYPSSNDILEIISYNIFSGGSSYADSDVNTHLNQSSASSGQVLSWNGSDYAWITTGAGSLSNIVEDTSPQLGGSLDANGNTIDMDGNELILDADGDSSIHASTDDQIDFKINSVDFAHIKPNRLELTSNNDDSGVLTELRIIQTTTSPAIYDYGGFISWYHENSAGESINYSMLMSRNLGHTDGSEEGRLEVYLMDSGTATLCYGWDNDLLQLVNQQGIYWYNFTSTHDGTLIPTTLSGTRTWTLPDATGTIVTTGNADVGTTTTSSSDADHVLINDGGVLKKITPTNLGIGSSGISVSDATALALQLG